MLKDTPLYLIGMMGAGKSAVGRELAEHLGYHFFDTDTLITQITQKSIPDLFALGEVYFRDLETQVLEQLAPYPRTVVATGGGMVLRAQNWRFLHTGLVIWLDVPLATLVARLSQTSQERPLLVGDLEVNLKRLCTEREALYRQADIQVEAIGSPAEVCKRVLTAIQTRLSQDHAYIVERIGR